jgi:hypothetical protein
MPNANWWIIIEPKHPPCMKNDETLAWLYATQMHGTCLGPYTEAQALAMIAEGLPQPPKDPHENPA